jgi:hypothetical protein
MSNPLKDFRLGITDQVDAALESQATAFGKDKQTVAREVLAEWAERFHRAHTVYASRLMANGSLAASAGSEPEPPGARRK